MNLREDCELKRLLFRTSVRESFYKEANLRESVIGNKEIIMQFLKHNSSSDMMNGFKS